MTRRVRFKVDVASATLVEEWEASVPDALEGDELLEELNEKLTSADDMEFIDQTSDNESERTIIENSIEPQ